jgi:murein DD-endopeptidase MepM/ murein hydrolase activator NlpD
MTISRLSGVLSSKLVMFLTAVLLASSLAFAATPQRADAFVSLGWCPTQGYFEDTFGMLKPDGRAHQGIDIMNKLGTPINAPKAGNVVASTTRLGGNSARLTTSQGEVFFFAHLAMPAKSGWTSAGQTIGLMGATGNAGGANHLHFEWRPDGTTTVNPTQGLITACKATKAGRGWLTAYALSGK